MIVLVFASPTLMLRRCWRRKQRDISAVVLSPCIVLLLAMDGLSFEKRKYPLELGQYSFFFLADRQNKLPPLEGIQATAGLLSWNYLYHSTWKSSMAVLFIFGILTFRETTKLIGKQGFCRLINGKCFVEGTVCPYQSFMCGLEILGLHIWALETLHRMFCSKLIRVENGGNFLPH